jgi:hypothetical protein
LIVCDLTLAGIGWNTAADAQLAPSAAARAREHRVLAKQERTTTRSVWTIRSADRRKQD